MKWSIPFKEEGFPNFMKSFKEPKVFHRTCLSLQFWEILSSFGLMLWRLKPHDQSSRSSVRLLPCKAKPIYFHSILNHMVRVPEAQSNCCYERQSWAMFARFYNHMVRVPKALSHRCHARQSLATYIQSLKNITSSDSVPSSCVRQHT